MMRLYDPNHNFTALTAQMDLETAEKLQRELADIIAKKRQNPDYQYRPQLYDSRLVPSGRLKGIDRDGNAMIELEPKETDNQIPERSCQFGWDGDLTVDHHNTKYRRRAFGRIAATMRLSRNGTPPTVAPLPFCCSKLKRNGHGRTHSASFSVVR